MKFRSRLALTLAALAGVGAAAVPTGVAEAGPVIGPHPGDGSAVVTIYPDGAGLTNGYRYNSSGGAVDAGKIDDTHYWVSFAQLGGGTYTNAQLTIWNGNDTSIVDPVCTIDKVKDNGVDVTMWFQCTAFPPNPLPGTSLFVHVTNAARPERFGVTTPGFVAVTTSDPTAAASTPLNQYRSAGAGAATVARTGLGQYTVTIPNAPYGAGEGVVFATALTVSPTVDPAYTRYCNPQNWFKSGTSMIVNVRCYMGAGILADARFSMRLSRRGFNGSATKGATQWVSNPAADYTPTTYGWNSTGGSRMVWNQGAIEGPGISLVEFAGVYDEARVNSALVSGYGGPQRCSVMYLGGHPAYGWATMTVRCYEPFTGVGNQSARYTAGYTEF